MRNRLRYDNLWQRFGFTNLEPEEFKKRTSAVNAAIFTVIAGIGHSLIYVLLGFPYVTIAVITYALCSIANLLYLRLYHNFDKFRNIQLLLISFFPFITQLFIGGFINGSAVAIAGFIAPATALLYVTNKRARGHFYLFAVLIILSSAWQILFAQHIVLPVYIITIFFAVNITSITAIIYFLMESFLKKQEELKTEVRASLENLKATQKQLIHSEKMASLGELTAGVAHEIQNPLNFVNNFSELNTELLGELEAAIEKEDTEEVHVIIKNLQENEQKIVYHGKRADSIVKGMLQHSRASTGKKELTDINALIDESLRLSYHGLRAKSKDFNATMKTDFDENIHKVKIVPQDVSRVLLNLFNNAFYAVNEKKKLLNGIYEPIVFVCTKEENNNISIIVKDNGNGIPQNAIDKIFQPFFTTKPTGQGTGLGLSLSYDIIKAHGGEIKVESKESEGTAFIIQLPVQVS